MSPSITTQDRLQDSTSENFNEFVVDDEIYKGDNVMKNTIIGEITPHAEPLILDLANMEEGGPTGEVNFEEWDDGNEEWRNYIEEKTKEWVKDIIARSVEDQTDRGRHDEEDRA